MLEGRAMARARKVCMCVRARRVVDGQESFY